MTRRDDVYEWESFSVCSCRKQGVCVVCRDWLDGKLFDMVDAWHACDGAPLNEPTVLHKYLGMTIEQYGRWLRDSGDIDDDYRKQACWGPRER